MRGVNLLTAHRKS